jgi:hypothetical protein
MRGVGGVLPDEWASMDALDLHHWQVKVSIVSQVKIIPKGAMGLWALSYRKAANKLADAMELGMDNHDKLIEVRRAFGWYSKLPQLLLRNHNINSERATKVITHRCNQFLNDKYGTLIKHWEDDITKELKRKRKQHKHDPEKKVLHAIKMVKQSEAHCIQRAVNRIEGHDIGTCDKP